LKRRDWVGLVEQCRRIPIRHHGTGFDFGCIPKLELRGLTFEKVQTLD